MKFLFFLSVFLLLTACGGDNSSQKNESITNFVAADDLLFASISLQSAQLKTVKGFNDFNNSVIDDSVQILTRAESMLKKINDSREIIIKSLDNIKQTFEINSSDNIIKTNASLSVAPFILSPFGQSTEYFLLSSNSRVLTIKNTIKTRFRNSIELSAAWLRAVEYSNQRCLYVALQSLNKKSVATTISNTLVVHLPAASMGECGFQI